MVDIKKVLAISRSTEDWHFAVDCGISVARKFGADLLVMHLASNPADLEAVNVPELFKTQSTDDFRSLQEETRKGIEKNIQDLTETGFPIRSIVCFGSAVDEVEKTVKQENVDLIVLLAHEEGRLEHVLFGGDNAAILRRLPCSIMLVKKEPGPVTWEREDESITSA